VEGRRQTQLNLGFTYWQYWESSSLT
jgi:hypothetical protein